MRKVIAVPAVAAVGVFSVLAYYGVTADSCAAQGCPRKVSADKVWTREDCEQCCRDTAAREWWNYCYKKIPCSQFPKSKSKVRK